jgi:hypothetical protein
MGRSVYHCMVLRLQAFPNACTRSFRSVYSDLIKNLEGNMDFKALKEHCCCIASCHREVPHAKSSRTYVFEADLVCFTKDVGEATRGFKELNKVFKGYINGRSQAGQAACTEMTNSSQLYSEHLK